MNTYLILSRLCQLQCCNKFIITLYERLGTADEERKKICIERSAKRQRIRTELDDRISKVRNEKGLWADKILYYLILQAIKGYFSVRCLFQSKNWEGVYKCELHNLNLYYETLYTPDVPKPIVDLLLSQKRI